jgi:hypothetical protein
MYKGLICLTAFISFGIQANENYMSEQQERELDRRAASQALEKMFPDPVMVKRGVELQERNRRAIMDALVPPSTQRIREIVIRRDVQRVHKLYVYPNQVTTLTISDSMGEPWPLRSNPIVGSDAYKVNYQEANPGFITIETQSKFVPSNLVFVLKDRLRPIQFQLISDNQILDSMVDIKINGKSPLNEIAVSRPYGGLNIPEPDGHDIAQFLGQAPKDAVQLTTVGDPNVKIWKWGRMTVLRAPYTLLNPSEPISVQSALDSDFKVYLVGKKVLLASFLNTKTSEIINVEVVGG